MWLTVIMLVCGLFGGVVLALSKREERDMEEKFGQDFIYYENRVPGFIPRLRQP